MGEETIEGQLTRHPSYLSPLSLESASLSSLTVFVGINTDLDVYLMSVSSDVISDPGLGHESLIRFHALKRTKNLAEPWSNGPRPFK